MIWRLLQVQPVDDVPLIAAGKMWTGLVAWAKVSMLGPRLRLANPADLEVPVCLESADQAIVKVRELHSAWLERWAASAKRPTNPGGNP